MLSLARLGGNFSASPCCRSYRHVVGGATASIRLVAGTRSYERTKRRFGCAERRLQVAPASIATEAQNLKRTPTHDGATDFARSLPVVCSGCGALSQTVESDAPGFYSQRSRNVEKERKQSEDDIYDAAMARLSAAEDGCPASQMPNEADFWKDRTAGPMICDRCHHLLHQSTGTSILHPSMQSIQDIIESSPHKHNHIYHVLDAADFPMSLIPNLVSALKLPRLRTQNRRSKTKQYIKGREAEVSFIITRSDLLAPQKEQVDRMMPYLQEVLRDALGRSGKNVRLGNVRCVSAKRGWWTPSVKQEIWNRGGAGWVVGKVNVGKSALFEAVYPKGRNGKNNVSIKSLRNAATTSQLDTIEAEETDPDSISASIPTPTAQDPALDHINSALEEGQEDSMNTMSQTASAEQPASEQEVHEEHEDGDDDASLLPPAQPETQYPHMPIVSALPGTTASPIRIPYGSGQGELIDLPGVMRSSMETHVNPEHHPSLVMKHRVVPEQYTLRPGQSLLLGGIVRITPKTDNLIFLAYPFTPLNAHATGNTKAIAIQTGWHEDGTPYAGTVESIATDKAKGRIKSAGTFKLDWDVTKKRAGALTDKTAGKQQAENLPFIVYGADILIEGVGWVEMVCQVRSRRKSLLPDHLSATSGQDAADADMKPEVEVFTPKGKFVGIRRPLNAWLQSGPKKVAKHAQKKRPRMSISLQKRREGGRNGGRAMNIVPN